MNCVLQAQESSLPNAYSSQCTTRSPRPEPNHPECPQQLCPGLGGPSHLSGPQLCPLLDEGPPGAGQELQEGQLPRRLPRQAHSSTWALRGVHTRESSCLTYAHLWALWPGTHSNKAQIFPSRASYGGQKADPVPLLHLQLGP